MTPVKIISFDATKLLEMLQTDCCFGYLITQKLAQVIHERLHDRRIESLSFKVA